MKREMIFNALRRNIITGTTPPGTKLPTELELASQYGVARDTLRDSLKKLEAEGLIERIKSRGTFVRQPEKSSSDKVISLLIPYPDYLRDRDTSSFRSFSDLSYGALRAASEEGWRVQTIPFSKSNDNRDIDWEALSCLQRDSRLIVFSQWYNTVFKAFLEREIRVGFIRIFGPHLKSPWDACFSAWIDGVFDVHGGIDSLVRLFHRRGCRRLLYLGGYLDDPLNELNITCRNTGGELGMEFIEMNLFSESNKRLGFSKALRQAWKNWRPDAIVGDCGGMFHPQDGFHLYQESGIPDSVKLVLFRDNPVYLKMCPQISAFSLNYDLMGYRMAKFLMAEPYSPRQFIQDVEFMDRESSGGLYMPSGRTQMEMHREPLSYYF